MAVFTVLWPYLLTTKLRSVIRHNLGHSKIFGINRRNLKIWVDVADKICFGVPENLEVGVGFWPCSEGDFLTRCL